MKFINEFKEFIMRGNVVDMAVGVVIGGAFKEIINSLVADIIMPCISVVIGKVNISSLALTVIKPDEASGAAGLVIPYGNFLQQILNFLIIAFAIFCTVKLINTMYSKFSKAAAAEDEPPKPTQEELLEQIRDLLRKQSEN